MTKIELLQLLIRVEFALVALVVLLFLARLVTPHALRTQVGGYIRDLLHIKSQFEI